MSPHFSWILKNCVICTPLRSVHQLDHGVQKVPNYSFKKCSGWLMDCVVFQNYKNIKSSVDYFWMVEVWTSFSYWLLIRRNIFYSSTGHPLSACQHKTYQRISRDVKNLQTNMALSPFFLFFPLVATSPFWKSHSPGSMPRQYSHISATVLVQ